MKEEIPSVSLPGSTFGGGNFAAEYIVVSIPWLVIALLYFRNKFLLTIGLCTLLLSLWYLCLCRNRAGYLSFVLSIVYGAILFAQTHKGQFSLYKYRKHLLYGVSIVVAAVLLGSIETEHLYRKSFISTIENISPYSTLPGSRLIFWKASLEMFKEHPLTGIGSSMWSGIFPRFRAASYTDKNLYFTDSINPHNDYLEMLSENGIILFSVYIALICLVVYRLHRKMSQDRHYILVAMSFVGILIIQLFAFPKDRTAPMLFFSFIVGIAFTDGGRTINVSSRILYPLLFIVSLANAGYVLFGWKR